MAWSLAVTPGGTVPKIQLDTFESGICRFCMATTCSSVIPATEPVRRVSQANACARRSIRAIGHSLQPPRDEHLLLRRILLPSAVWRNSASRTTPGAAASGEADVYRASTLRSTVAMKLSRISARAALEWSWLVMSTAYRPSMKNWVVRSASASG